MDTLVIATKNPGKISELRALLSGERLTVLGLDDLNAPTIQPEEIGQTFLDNATIKALDYAAQTNLPCLADDSGLEVDALGGKPGVISSHYAWDGDELGEAAALSRQQRDSRNNHRLLKELEGVPEAQRTAMFVCTMVLAKGTDVLATTTGTFEGRIGMPPRVPAGEHGFGYDPLFLVAPHYDKTSAEIDRHTKNKLSHRGHALREMIHKIRDIQKTT